jgi:hypothetical protein
MQMMADTNLNWSEPLKARMIIPPGPQMSRKEACRQHFRNGLGAAKLFFVRKRNGFS